jgi:hypothetical protein
MRIGHRWNLSLGSWSRKHDLYGCGLADSKSAASDPERTYVPLRVSGGRPGQGARSLRACQMHLRVRQLARADSPRTEAHPAGTFASPAGGRGGAADRAGGRTGGRCRPAVAR